MNSTQQCIEPHIFRQALASMATPVAVVTTELNGQRFGFTANSFTSISMEPPLLGVYIAETASAHAAFMQADTVAFNILAADQEHVARQFATSGIDKFAGIDFDPAFSQVPVLTGTQVSFVGTVVERPVLGDHVLLLVAPTQSTSLGPPPLIYHQRTFCQLPKA